jgi:hypothetical protein
MHKDQLKAELSAFVENGLASVDEDGEVDLGAAAAELEEFVSGLEDEDDAEDESDDEPADGPSKA